VAIKQHPAKFGNLGAHLIDCGAVGNGMHKVGFHKASEDLHSL
jgi:hypothetical protein